MFGITVVTELTKSPLTMRAHSCQRREGGAEGHFCCPSLPQRSGVGVDPFLKNTKKATEIREIITAVSVNALCCMLLYLLNDLRVWRERERGPFEICTCIYVHSERRTDSTCNCAIMA